MRYASCGVGRIATSRKRASTYKKARSILETNKTPMRILEDDQQIYLTNEDYNFSSQNVVFSFYWYLLYLTTRYKKYTTTVKVSTDYHWCENWSGPLLFCLVLLYLLPYTLYYTLAREDLGTYFLHACELGTTMNSLLKKKNLKFSWC